MRRRLVNLAGNLMLATASLFAALLALEYGLFRYVLVPDDVIRNVTIDGVVRYEPGTRAVMRNPDHSSFLVTINEQGWNSTKARYSIDRRPGVLRVAVVGDSYVQAASVDVGDNFAEVLERELNGRGVRAEVYRFGMDGAPLSQYLHMLRHEVVRYQPDVVLVLLIHNDFDESFRMLSTRYASSFLKVVPGVDGCCTEVPPVDFEPGLADTLRNFRTFRYLYYETGLYLHLRALSNLWWGGTDLVPSPEFVSSAVDIRNVQDLDTIAAVARYVMEQMRSLAAARHFKLLFAMDGVREAIYSGRPRTEFKVAALNDLAARLTHELDLPFLDLQGVFAEDYRLNKLRLEYPWDWHWNRHANALVGSTLADFVIANRPPQAVARR